MGGSGRSQSLELVPEQKPQEVAPTKRVKSVLDLLKGSICRYINNNLIIIIINFVSIRTIERSIGFASRLSHSSVTCTNINETQQRTKGNDLWEYNCLR